MPKYKNGKVVWTRFKAQGLIKSKYHLDFQKNNIYKEVPWETNYSIESSQSIKPRKYSSSKNLDSRCEGNEVLNS